MVIISDRRMDTDEQDNGRNLMNIRSSAAQSPRRMTRLPSLRGRLTYTSIIDRMLLVDFANISAQAVKDWIANWLSSVAIQAPNLIVWTGNLFLLFSPSPLS